ncbi:MAG TPA: DUF4118 domain-containing protein, partial [Casimicrobiaceae bacterium]|nr:DUF4118 domain-containing protein [Casimicrobiaceae bacterium]
MAANDTSLNTESSLQRLIRGLLWIGTGFLIGAALAIIWAVFQTRGVDDFLTALTVAGLGFGLPSVIAFSVAWLLSSFDDGQMARASDADTAQAPPAERPVSQVILGYLIAIAAVGLAWALRAWLAPVLGSSQPYITFYLAIAVAGWLGGFGPAVVATTASFAVAWFWYLPPGAAFRFEHFEDLVGMGLFIAGALGIAAITAGLRAARDHAQRMAHEANAR